MNLKEIKIGQFFTIDNTKSYPKLRTSYGYIDVRDEIKKECKDLDWELDLMADEEVLTEFQKYGIDTMEKLLELKQRLLKL